MGALIAVAAVGATACGEEPPPPTREPGSGAPEGPRLLVGALGDSITAGYPAWSPIRSQRPKDPNRKSQYEYWARRLDPDLRFRNCGVPGERTDQIAKRLDACAKGVDALIVQGGTNDLKAEVPVARIAANLERMVKRAKRLNVEVAIADVLPWNGGHPTADGLIAGLNRQIGGIARRERVTLLRFNEALADPRQFGLMRSRWEVDGVHPSVAGYRRLGRTVANGLG